MNFYIVPYRAAGELCVLIADYPFLGKLPGSEIRLVWHQFHCPVVYLSRVVASLGKNQKCGDTMTVNSYHQEIPDQLHGRGSCKGLILPIPG